MTVDWDDYVPGLAAAYASLGSINPISAIEATADTLSTQQRLQVIAQAEFGLRNVYAHLPLKRARHAMDPFLALHLVSRRVAAMTDREFHSEMMQVFKALGDIHTSYRPPPPHDRMVAFLPFLVEQYFESGQPRYLVTRILEGLDHSTFKAGVEVVSWSGVPIDQAVAAIGSTTAGSNVGTELALAVHFLTVRWLGFSLPPQERWVDVGYMSGGQEHEIRLPWALLEMDPKLPSLQIGDQAIQALSHAGEAALSSCLNVHAHVEHTARRHLFAPEKVAAAEAQRNANRKGLQELTQDGPDAPGQEADHIPGAVPSLLPELFEASIIERDSVRYGYIRIRSFTYAQEGFVAEFRRLLLHMPNAGLILDIRGNPGGVIQDAESLLQLLTPKTVVPLGFQFLSTPVTRALSHPPGSIDGQALARRTALQDQWGASIDVALETGAAYSKSSPLTSPASANQFGQSYYGPVVLITDSMTYSSGDMFAAGFQDLGIGPVIGVGRTTGAGGANVWSHGQLVTLLPDVAEFEPLEGGVEITYAIRRCLRGGAFAGMPIEELGVVGDAPRHQLTRRDVLHNNEDLLSAAAQALAGLPQREYRVELARTDSGYELSLQTAGVDRVDVYVDDRPRASVDVDDTGRASITIERDPTSTTRAVVARGFCEGELVAVSRIEDPEA